MIYNKKDTKLGLLLPLMVILLSNNIGAMTARRRRCDGEFADMGAQTGRNLILDD